jgi:hypothetical protein
MLAAALQTGSNEYALGHSDRELDRLRMQPQIFEPFTRQLFHEAGLGSGMHVSMWAAEVAMWHFSRPNWLDQLGVSSALTARLPQLPAAGRERKVSGYRTCILWKAIQRR